MLIIPLWALAVWRDTCDTKEVSVIQLLPPLGDSKDRSENWVINEVKLVRGHKAKMEGRANRHHINVGRQHNYPLRPIVLNQRPSGVSISF